jgi:hypothetical protein
MVGVGGRSQTQDMVLSLDIGRPVGNGGRRRTGKDVVEMFNEREVA